MCSRDRLGVPEFDGGEDEGYRCTQRCHCSYILQKGMEFVFANRVCVGQDSLSECLSLKMVYRQLKNDIDEFVTDNLLTGCTLSQTKYPRKGAL